MKFTDNLALQGIVPSIGSVGDAYDNALMETINGLYKAECIRCSVFTPEVLESVVDMDITTSSWVNWYNNERLHSRLGMVPLAEFEGTFWTEHATLRQVPEKAIQPILRRQQNRDGSCSCG